MSDSRYSYDDTSEVWPYFVITLASVVTIPLTLVALGKLTTKEDTNALPSFSSRFSPKNKSYIDKHKSRAKRSKVFTKL